MTESVLRWRPGSAKFRVLAGVLLSLCAAYDATYLAVIAVAPGPHPFGDSFALWTWARFLVSHEAAAIYDPLALQAAQRALGMDPAALYPFVYPPSFMLVLRPLGFLPYAAACWIGLLITLPLYLLTAADRPWRSPMLLAALLMPTTAIAIVAGQTGFLAAALFLGGFRLMPRHPVLGGVVLGLLSYKPQFGLLIPIALLSAGTWRTTAACCATVVALALATSAAFGWSIWNVWARAMSAYTHEFAAEGTELLHLMPTVDATLRQWGLDAAVARTGQGVATILAATAVWYCFRDGPSRLAVAGLAVATFLATPYAFVYDMPLASAAIIWLIAERHRAGGSFGLGEMAILVLATIAPLTMPAGGHPFAAIVLVGLLGVIVRRVAAVRSGSVAIAAAATVSA